GYRLPAAPANPGADRPLRSAAPFRPRRPAAPPYRYRPGAQNPPANPAGERGWLQKPPARRAPSQALCIVWPVGSLQRSHDCAQQKYINIVILNTEYAAYDALRKGSWLGNAPDDAW